MKPTIRFPTDDERLARDVREFLGASAQQRFDAVIEISELCERLLEASPHRARQVEILDELEELEHERWKALIRAHVRSEAGPDATC